MLLHRFGGWLHFPLVQTSPGQQPAGVALQGWAYELQEVATAIPQIPSWHSRPPQQDIPAPQAAPCPAQDWQVPLTHNNEPQHGGIPAPQKPPSPAHGWQLLLTQKSWLQQFPCPPPMQVSPTFWQPETWQ